MLLILVMLYAIMVEAQVNVEQSFLTAENKSLHWGTYRPNLYHGMRTKSSDSIQTGFIWFGLNDYNGWQDARHDCDMGQGLKYGYHYHNGRDFASQEITDGKLGFRMVTTLVKNPKDQLEWVLEVEGNADLPVSLIYYVFTEADSPLDSEKKASGSVKFSGSSKDLGPFEHIVTNSNDPADVILHGLLIGNGDLHKIKEIAMELVISEARKAMEEQESKEYPPPDQILRLKDFTSIDGNVMMVQKILRDSFKFQIIQKAPKTDVSTLLKVFENNVEIKKENFDNAFEGVFKLTQKGFDEHHVDFAKGLFSDVMGGLGFFHGDSIVDYAQYETYDKEDNFSELDELERLVFQEPENKHNSEVLPEISRTGPLSLLTFTPSRPFFPRGFLWDEGFHHVIVGAFDSGIVLASLENWFHLMDDNGWIAREQILGEEARRKVPEKFQVQYPSYANPPTLVIPVSFLTHVFQLKQSGIVVDNIENNIIYFDGQNTRDVQKMKAVLEKNQLEGLYDGLVMNFKWYLKTQKSNVAKDQYLFRWRGRTETHCLPSGLDDYPRPPASANEINIDLLSWVGFYAKTLQSVAEYLEKAVDIQMYKEIVDHVSNNVVKYHWNEEEGLFCDALLSDDGSETEEHFCHAGYISLMPFIHGLIDLNSRTIEQYLELLRDPDQLWSPYGIKSLSSSHELYGKGENYWRGPIWINVNYLILRALKIYYMTPECPYAKEATSLYKELRKNIISNVKTQYDETGYTFEQYNPDTGAGQRSHPFNGWTALVVNIMAEIY